MDLMEEFFKIGMFITFAVIAVIAIFTHPDDTTKY